MIEIASVAPSPARAPAADPGAAAPAADARPAPPAVPVPVPAATPPEPPARSREALQQQIDRVLEHSDTSLRFRVDDESDRVVVSVLDGQGEVILQIPDEAALEMARHLARTGSLVELRA